MKLRLLGLFVLCSAVLGVTTLRDDACAEPERLNLYVAAGLKKAMDVVVERFTQETGLEVFPNYGPSGGLYTQIIKGQPCDVYFTADWALLEKLEEKQLVVEKKRFLKDFIVLVVSKTGAQKGIRSFEDLTKDGVVLSVADSRAPVGRYAEKGLSNLGLLDTILAKGNLKAKPNTVNQLSIMVEKDQVDAGLIFRSVANMYGLPPVAVMGLDATGDIVFGVGTIKGGNEALGKKFMEFAVEHISEFVKYGWEPYE